MATAELRPGHPVELRDDAAAVARAVADFVAARAVRAIAEEGVFRLALAGGTTPKAAYGLLCHAQLPWERVEVYFGDERCLPLGDAARNDVMAAETLLHQVPIPANHIHPIPAELGPEKAAAAYAEILARSAPMHLALLGMGEDGHTASLFPGQDTLADPRLAVPVYHAPKPPPERVSMGLAALNAAAARLVMVAGLSKYPAMARLRAGETLPVALLGPSLWLVDRQAWNGG
jgi:6-phosphogluconolactonase